MAQAAYAWSRPDGLQSLDDTYAALRKINFSLQDIVAFWTSHVGELDGTSNSLSTASMTKWRRYKTSLERAMHSVMETSDLIVVNAAGSPQVSSSSWTHFFGRIFRFGNK
jgi:hypothetical protein